MPTIDHKDQPPVPTPATAPTVASAQPSDADLASRIAKILQQQKAIAAEPPKVDWSKITEQDAYNPAVYIPVVDHDVPDYMNMKLKDQEYMCVWANKDQRRLGALLAEGYELLKPEHVHPQFQVPLVWSSEKTYEYADVVCMRVHKSILFSKRRKAMEISMKQMKNNNRPPSNRTASSDSDLELGAGLSLYDASL